MAFHSSLKRIDLIILTLFIISIFFWYGLLGEYSVNFASNTIIDSKDNISVSVFFCPIDDCETELEQKILNSEEVRCAFYDLSLGSIINALETTNSKLIIDRDYEHRIENSDLDYITDKSSRYMHNKFCIFDGEIVFTGSMNPTNNDANINANNILFINSTKIAENYLDKFNRMFHEKEFKNRNAKTPLYPTVVDEFNEVTIETLFCPESRCEENVLRTLKLANESIYFLMFSFTSVPIGDLLIQKIDKGVEVKGIFENWLNSNSQWSRYNILKQEKEENFLLSKPPGRLHHKFFIIDEKIIITGSYNPSNNANKNNDENIIIIHNKDIASKYLYEFQRKWVEYEKNI